MQQRYRELVVLLDDEEFVKRTEATNALRAMGLSIQPYLSESLRTAKSLEAKTRLTALLEQVSQRIQLVQEAQVLQSLVRSVRYSPAGKLLLVAGYNDSIELLDASNLKVVSSIETTNNVKDALFLSKGTRIAAAVNDKVQFWSTETGEQSPISFEYREGIACITASPDSKLLLTLEAKKIRLWSITEDSEKGR